MGEAEAVSEIIREENTGRDMLGITDSRESEEDRYEYMTGMGSRSRGVQDGAVEIAQSLTTSRRREQQ